jgi:predicted nicotinamide N-methyase
MPPLFKLETSLHSYAGKCILLLGPDEDLLQENYGEGDLRQPVPFWARVWPSAKALCNYLENNLDLVQGKRVVELGAGLGLPSLVSAKFAEHVLCTDCCREAVEIVSQSAAVNQLLNTKCCCYDWHTDEVLPDFDVLLLSDINYDPSSFERLYHLISHYWETGKTIVIATPTRLMGKPFVEQLLPFCRETTSIDIVHCGISTEIFILLLTKESNG